MGQPVFAAFAAFSNVDLSAFGTFAATSRWINVTANPASVFSKFTVAFVSIESGVRPSFPSSPERAIEKHPEWAAAMSSSGFVPGAFSNRCAKEYGVPFRTPLAVETVPFPSFKPPFQTAFAYRCTMSVAPADVNPGSHLTLRARRLYRHAVLAQVPIAAVSGRASILDAVEPGVVSHAETFNANPFSVAAARTAMEEILTRPAMDGAARIGDLLGDGYRDIQADRKVEGLVQYKGISGPLALGPAPVVDWRTFLDLDVRRWWGYYIAMMNRGIAPMATGPDEQWTVSVQHSAADVDAHVAAFDEVAQLLRALRADVHLVESV